METDRTDTEIKWYHIPVELNNDENKFLHYYKMSNKDSVWRNWALFHQMFRCTNTSTYCTVRSLWSWFLQPISKYEWFTKYGYSTYIYPSSRGRTTWRTIFSLNLFHISSPNYCFNLCFFITCFQYINMTSPVRLAAHQATILTIGFAIL